MADYDLPSLPTLIEERRALTTELCRDQMELSGLLIAEKSNKLEAYIDSSGSTNQQRDNDAARAAFPLTEQIFELRGKITTRELQIAQVDAEISAFHLLANA